MLKPKLNAPYFVQMNYVLGDPIARWPCKPSVVHATVMTTAGDEINQQWRPCSEPYSSAPCRTSVINYIYDGGSRSVHLVPIWYFVASMRTCWATRCISVAMVYYILYTPHRIASQSCWEVTLGGRGQVGRSAPLSEERCFLIIDFIAR